MYEITLNLENANFLTRNKNRLYGTFRWVLANLASEVGGRIPIVDGLECVCFCSPSEMKFARINVKDADLANSCPVMKHDKYDYISSSCPGEGAWSYGTFLYSTVGMVHTVYEKRALNRCGSWLFVESQICVYSEVTH